MLASTLLVAGLAASTTPETCSTVSVQIANLAGVSPADLARTQAEAGRIFHQAGITIDWQTYQVSKPGPGCPVRLIVSIVAHATAPASHFAMGYSTGAVHAIIFWDRVQELAQTAGSPQVILGHAIAHELGHLLMGADHSPIGVMRPKWSKPDVKMAAQGRLQFTPSQRDALRIIVARRSSLAT